MEAQGCITPVSLPERACTLFGYDAGYFLITYACVIHHVLNMSGMFWAPILSPDIILVQVVLKKYEPSEAFICTTPVIEGCACLYCGITTGL